MSKATPMHKDHQRFINELSTPKLIELISNLLIKRKDDTLDGEDIADWARATAFLAGKLTKKGD